MKVTLADIAREAGVSKATVSYVLNRRGNISDAKREEILALIAKHDYRPTKRRKALRKGKSGLKYGVVAALFPHSTASLRRSWGEEYINSILSGAESALRGTSANLMIVTMDDSGQLPECIQDRRVDGVICVAFKQHPPLLPVPAVGAFSPLYSRRLDLVACDHEACGRAAAEQLFEKGCRRCAIVNPFGGHSGFRLRKRAFLETLHDADVDAQVIEVEHAGGSARFAELTQALLAQADNLDGIFIPGSDRQVAAIAVELQKHNGKPPAGLKVVSCASNIEVFAQMNLGMDYVDIRVEDIGAAAADLLLWRLQNPKAALRKVMIQPQVLA